MFFKDGLGVRRRDVWRGALITAAALTLFKTAVFTLDYFETANATFGSAGLFLAMMLVLTGAIIVVYYGAVFTHAMLVRRGGQASAE